MKGTTGAVSVENIGGRGRHTRSEIMSQPAPWREALGIVAEARDSLFALWERSSSSRVIFTGCGSTYYLALAAAAQLRHLTGRQVQGMPASELWSDPAAFFVPGDILVAISRSGTTTETLRACEAFIDVTATRPLTIQCTTSSPLSELGSLNVVIASGAEESVAQTRSFASMFVAATAINLLWSGRKDSLRSLEALPDAGERMLQAGLPIAREWGTRLDFDRIYLLGSGSRYGLACEASLKMKEMTLTHSEPFHFFEFRHGPMSMVTDTTLIVGLVSERTQAEEEKVLREMTALGATVIALGERVGSVERGVALAFSSGLPEEGYGALYLPPIHTLALERSLAKGLDPDRPKNLSAVIVLQ